MSTPARITHLIGGTPWRGTAGAPGAVSTRHGRADRQRSTASPPWSTRSSPAPTGVAGAGTASLAKRTQVLFAFRELLNARKDEIRVALITAEHGKVLSDALGETTRGLEVVEFARHTSSAQGGTARMCRPGRRLLIRQPSGVVAVISRSTSGHGSDVVVPIAIACGQHRRHQSVREGPVGRQRRRCAVARGRPAGRASFNVVHGDKVAVDALLTHPLVTSVPFVGSTPIAQVRLRDRHRQRQARSGPRRREEPHARPARRRLDLAADARSTPAWRRRRALHGDLGADRGRQPVADELISKITDRWSKLVTGDGKGRDMGPLVTRALRQGDVIRPTGRRRGATLVVDGAAARSTRMVRASSSAHALRPGHPDMSIYLPTRSSAGAVGPPGRSPTTRACADQRQRLWQRHRDLHQ